VLNDSERLRHPEAQFWRRRTYAIADSAHAARRMQRSFAAKTAIQYDNEPSVAMTTCSCLFGIKSIQLPNRLRFAIFQNQIRHHLSNRRTMLETVPRTSS
jgi:hypothetical protein